MLQVIQYQKTGEMFIKDLPVPKLKEGSLLVKNIFSLISSGTERTSVETARASLLGKAKSRPDLVKQVIDNVKSEGIFSTYTKVKNRLDNYKELGYSSAGIVLESSIGEFKKGDRVACAGFAYHAEYVVIPKNLVAKIPNNVGFDEAVFTTLGSIALQGVRQSEVKIGEIVVVLGLGLLGLITVQLLKASGCDVIGIDVNNNNFDLARKLGCDLCILSSSDNIKKVESKTRGFGADSVIITAGTNSNFPIELASKIVRQKGKLVIVGAIGMNIPRSPFYEKELDVRFSCSYGPGRYDDNYEEKGQDYPFGYVRWTENRNMIAILDLLSQKKIETSKLVTHIFPIQESLKAYEMITNKSKEKYLGILISYNNDAIFGQKFNNKVWLNKNFIKESDSNVNIGFIGAGNFAQSYLIPELKNKGLTLKGISTLRPINSKSVAEKFGFQYCTSDSDQILSDNQINSVFIATRHDSHSHYIIQALKNKKNVFTEKPLAITESQLLDISKTYTGLEELGEAPALSIGYNRRFSCTFNDIHKFFENRLEPLLIIYRVNAGFIPKSHWIQDESQGGRIIGEICHFIDTMQYLTNSIPVKVFAETIHSSNTQLENKDSICITISFSDGSAGSIIYLATGDRSVSKEYCEVYCNGKTAIMDNFTKTSFHENGKLKIKKYNGSKGHKEEMEHVCNVLKSKCIPSISFKSIYYTSMTTFKILESLKRQTFIEIQ